MKTLVFLPFGKPFYTVTAFIITMNVTVYAQFGFPSKPIIGRSNDTTQSEIHFSNVQFAPNNSFTINAGPITAIQPIASGIAAISAGRGIYFASLSFSGDLNYPSHIGVSSTPVLTTPGGNGIFSNLYAKVQDGMYSQPDDVLWATKRLANTQNDLLYYYNYTGNSNTPYQLGGQITLPYDFKILGMTSVHDTLYLTAKRLDINLSYFSIKIHIPTKTFISVTSLYANEVHSYNDKVYWIDRSFSSVRTYTPATGNLSVNYNFSNASGSIKRVLDKWQNTVFLQHSDNKLGVYDLDNGSLITDFSCFMPTTPDPYLYCYGIQTGFNDDVSVAMIDTPTSIVTTKEGSCANYNTNTFSNNSVIVGRIAPFVAVATNNNSLAAKISISPNPTNDVLNINTIDCTIEKINLSNVLGQNLGTHIAQNTISLAHLPQGYYFLNIITNKGNLVKKVFLQ